MMANHGKNLFLWVPTRVKLVHLNIDMIECIKRSENSLAH